MRSTLIAKFATLAWAGASMTICAIAANTPGELQSLPASTAIPVSFVRTVDAKKAKVGDTVSAKTMQVVQVEGGIGIQKGAVLSGHVVEVQTFQFDPAPYARQKPSEISIHFDKLQDGDAAILVNLSVRAIASTLSSQDAERPHYLDETDRLGTITLIGGTEFTPFDKIILSSDGDAIGYNRKSGVFARLFEATSSVPGAPVRCRATDTEQSIAIFSPDACGAYGLGGDYLAANGDDGSGTFTLASRGKEARLYAGSTALLQVVATK